MRLVITGGGTGGHIYPAIEVGRLAAEHGAELFYFGSLRGQESKICRESKIPFQGFPAFPLYSLKTVRGLKAAVNLQRARFMARRALKATAPDIVFSTGGYSAGPVVAAARDLKIPFTMHTVDSIPPRSLSIFAKNTAAFTCTFRSTVELLSQYEVTRTGQPIRPELREAAAQKREGDPLVLVLGGSQGSQYLNETVPLAAAVEGFETRVVHICGSGHVESTSKLVEKLGIADRYDVIPFLNTTQMAKAYRLATMVVTRSGGTLAELAMFGLPSVLVPLPFSANNHQFHNAMEFVNMNAATLLEQSTVTPEAMSKAMSGWLSHRDRRDSARRHLYQWDIPDATDRIVALLEGALR